MSDKWVLITGASSGIGLAMAKQYAEKKYNVVLIARRSDRLNQLAADLERAHQIKTHIIIQDLSTPDAAEKIINNTKEHQITVDVLVNNAGRGLKNKMMSCEWIDIAQFLNLMINSMTQLTYYYLKDMMKRDSGRIIFISSTVAHFPGTSSMALYNAVKTYMNKLCTGLWSEAKAHGVYLTVVCPGFTHTEFQKAAGYEQELKNNTPSWIWMDADTVARLAIQANEQERVLVTLGWINKLIHAVMMITPQWLWRMFDSRFDKLKK